jgi:hypothetical protein
LGKHPWSLTLRQLLDRIEREFGGQHRALFVLGPRGRVNILFLVREASPEHFATVLGINPDEELAPSTLRSICVQLGIPPDVFGLEQEEPYHPDPDVN